MAIDSRNDKNWDKFLEWQAQEARNEQKSMKIIDLLNKIANGEEVPKKIKVLFNVFEYDEDNYCYKNVDETLDSLLKHLAFYKGIALNTEVEIIEDTPKEDNKIEKIKYMGETVKEDTIIRKINEIIDKINGKDNVEN